MVSVEAILSAKSPYPRVTTLVPGRVFEAHMNGLGFPGEYGTWMRFSDAMRAMALRHAKRVLAPPKAAAGSIMEAEGHDRGLNYWVVDGAALAELAPGVIEWVNGELRERVADLIGQALLPLDEVSQSAALNILARGCGYEWHFDSHPITGVIFLSCHNGEPGLSGEFVYGCYEASQLVRVPTHEGGFLVGDLTQTPHAVCPCVEEPLRISMPVGWGVPGHTGTDQGSKDFIYGK